MVPSRPNRELVSSSPSAKEPVICPLARASSCASMPCSPIRVSSSASSSTTWAVRPGRQAAYMPNRPASRYPALKENTEYARPRCSRMFWNRREDIPPPRIDTSTDSAWRSAPSAGIPSPPSKKWFSPVVLPSRSAAGAARAEAAGPVRGERRDLGGGGARSRAPGTSPSGAGPDVRERTVGQLPAAAAQPGRQQGGELVVLEVPHGGDHEVVGSVVLGEVGAHVL